MKKTLLVGSAVLVMAALPAFALAQTEAVKPVNGHLDRMFVMTAAQGGMAEVELSKLAADRASSPQVKEFSERMIVDHGKANEELMAIAQGKNITLPSHLSKVNKALRDRLTGLSGASFDQSYMHAMVKDHVAAVALFMKEAQTGKDPDFKTFASTTLPKLEEHLKMARSTDEMVVGTSGRK